METRAELFIGGSWVEPSTDEVIEVISPVTEEVVARVAAAAPADVDKAVAAARKAFDDGPWPHLDPKERVDAVRRLAAIYKERRSEMAQAITTELGAPTGFANRAQVMLPLTIMNALAEQAGEIQWEEARPGLYGQDILLRKEPIGVIAAIVPWNMPQFLITAKLVPALLAGCCVVVKPAPESPLDALLLAEMIEQIGLPEGVVSILPGGRETGAHLVSHPGIDKVSFTGSTAAGRKVALACAENLTRVHLELGGKSAAIVLDDADPAVLAGAIRGSSLSNSGQLCNALTRVLVPAARQDEFVTALATTLESMTIGDPSSEDTIVGPLVAKRQQDVVRSYIESGIEEGARLVTGGPELPDNVDKGWYVKPTLFADARNDMRIAQEEIFGPVITVIPYEDTEDAVAIANDSEYGLAGSVFTADVERGLQIADKVRTGTFGVNQGYSMDPAAPFGGVKASGYGRELGKEGIEAYLDLKSVSVAAPAKP